MALERIQIGDWECQPQANRLTHGDTVAELEPQVMDLLLVFADRPGEVLTKTEIIEAVWGEVIVNDDALSRALWKLRRALGDDAKSPRYIETVPKRGYRLIADVSYPPSAAEVAALVAHMQGEDSSGQGFGRWRAAVIVSIFAVIGFAGTAVLEGWFTRASDPPPVQATSSVPEDDRLRRADAFYAQYDRAQNASARQLYEAVLAQDPDNAAALAGLSNTIVQPVIRWDGVPDGESPRRSVVEALASNAVDSQAARAALDRAEGLARRAAELDPGHARAWRALGLALSAQREFAAARDAYDRALVIEPNDWGSLINMSELARLHGELALSDAYLEQAFEAMQRRYSEDEAQVRPWQSATGLIIASRKREAGALSEAELWYRRVLSLDPLNQDAVSGLADLLRVSGDAAAAEALCADLERRTGDGCLPVED